MNTRGQGLSITTIIIAALALIVLVVLVMIFTGRIAIFERGVGEKGSAELATYQVQYGDCHPSSTVESNFLTAMNRAATPADEDAAKQVLRGLVDQCTTRNQAACTGDCAWQ